MRPGQQNRRPRGRTNNNGGSNNNNNNGNNNNRGRQQNPLARSYESSGPDVKIRGNAQHIAERYAQLARDSLSSGDRVMAENYLQHAEHYNRIIAAAMLQQAQFTEQQRREWDEEAADGENEEGDENAVTEQSAENVNGGEVSQPVNGEAHQQQSGQNNNRERGNFQNRQERGERQPRPERNNQERNDRQPRAVFVAPIDDSQPVIEGTPAEFANDEAAGLARTLGLTGSRVELRLAEPVENHAAVETPVDAEAPRAARPRRAPRKAAEVSAAVETAPEPAAD
jgi:Domain of unknown function (DUF4167)